jgi:hypothetical protein
MLTRTAIYEGRIQPGREDEFFERVRTELEPLWQQFPNVLAVRVQRVRSADKDARPVVMILEMDFADMEAIEACMASPIRPKAHAATEAVMTLLDGGFFHVVSEATTLPPAR